MAVPSTASRKPGTGVGLNLAYIFNPHVSADIGYNYDDVTSVTVQPGYNRNRVYVGVTGTY